MPELPEVETICRGIQPHLEGQQITKVIVRHQGLRWPVSSDMHSKLATQTVTRVSRRAKYLLFEMKTGTVIFHLGMSGRLRVLTQSLPPQKHDHVDLELSNQKILRFTDPRRFGAFLWTDQPLAWHRLFKNLGPEPNSKKFSSVYLWKILRKKTAPIKSLIMNAQLVVGVGNIYATEALFMAGIHPTKPGYQLSMEQCEQLVKAIKHILRKAIQQGGTTLKDFVDSEGKPGYFAQHLNAYGRQGLPCIHCKTPLKMLRISQRSTVYCEVCQK